MKLLGLGQGLVTYFLFYLDIFILGLKVGGILVAINCFFGNCDGYNQLSAAVRLIKKGKIIIENNMYFILIFVDQTKIQMY